MDPRIPRAEEWRIHGAGVRDLDAQAVARLLNPRASCGDEETPPPTANDMRNFGLTCDWGMDSGPTLYGILACGRTPQLHRRTSSFLVRCGAYEGRHRGTEVILAGEADGRLDEQVRRALGWFRSLGWREKYDGVFRENIPRLPPEALREALVNAVAHRDYAASGSPILLDVFCDRAEVTSPGTLPDHLTVEAVRAGGTPQPRNERMAALLVKAGLMAGRGRGWLLMRQAMQKFNGTEPELINAVDADYFRVTLRFHAPDIRRNAEDD